MSVLILSAKRLSGPLDINASVERGWQQCAHFEDFQMRGGMLTQRTQMRLAYDDEALYVALVMHEQKIDALRTDTSKRTRDIGVRPWINEDDSIQVLIDPKRDGIHYRHFLVNPAGKWMTSSGIGSPERIECDYHWTPKDWEFAASVEADRWIVRMRIPASDLGLDKLDDGQLLGFNVIRERAPEPHETSFVTADTMSWTTQWTSHVSYEPSEFAVLALGEVKEAPEAFPVVEWQPPAPATPREGVTIVPVCEEDVAARRTQPILADRNLWFIHPPLESFKGMETSRLARFADVFGWRLRREINEHLDLEVPENQEWTWWFYGFDPEKYGQNCWVTGVSEEKIATSVFTIQGRRHTQGECLPPFRNMPEVARKGFEQLVEKFGDRFIGFPFDEWDSDVWSVATGMRERPVWDDYAELTPRATGNREEEERTLRGEWELFSRLSYDYIVPLNCWRCVDHYALEWGGRCAYTEVSENGNPSMLTQLAFARGAARQYGTYFVTYQATMMGTGYTSYEQGGQYDANVETVWATGPHFGVSIELYRRLLFTSYLSGATVQVFEHPQAVHVMPADAEGEHKLTPHGDVFADVLEHHERYEDRGVPYQPVALVLDYMHGFAPPYQTCPAKGRSGMQTWFSVPYERGDHQVYQTFRTLFPWCRQRIERNGYTLVNTPFGAIFDVLVANPPSGAVALDVLGGYRVAVLVGDVRFDDALKARLVEYVDAGGTLVVNALHYGELPEELTGGDVLFESDGVSVTAKNVGRGRVIATPESDLLDDDNEALPVLGEILATVSAEVAPVRVTGDVQYHFLKTTDGWLVGLLNNRGIVHHSRRAPDHYPEEVAQVELEYDGPVNRSTDRISAEAIAWSDRRGTHVARVTVPIGGVRIIEIA